LNSSQAWLNGKFKKKKTKANKTQQGHGFKAPWLLVALNSLAQHQVSEIGYWKGGREGR